jgi:hypothetical protein
MGRLSLIICCLAIACSGSNQKSTSVSPTTTAPLVAATTPLKPQLGKISIVVPRGWSINAQGVVKQKDKEIYTFTRQMDERLWANPGSFGTSRLPVMSMTVTLRDANISRADLEPQRLGESLVKQKVFTKLITAKKLQVANREASLVVGDTLERNYTNIIMLASEGYLYKWTLDGVGENDVIVNRDFNTMLESAVANK